MRISDWSSDVCSSDLITAGRARNIDAVDIDADRRVRSGGWLVLTLPADRDEHNRGRRATSRRNAERWSGTLQIGNRCDLRAIQAGRGQGGDGDWRRLKRLAGTRSEAHTSERPSLMRIS